MSSSALADYAAAYGLAYAALRYFNASGASPDGDLGEDHDPETHLIPLVLQVALGQRPRSRSSAPIIPRPTAPASAITSTSTIWAPRTSWRWSDWPPAGD